MTVRRRILAACAAAIVCAVGPAAAQERTGAEIYGAACAACHGADGRGNPPSVVGFDVPLPDFSDCSFASVEPDADWLAVTHRGGPARAFDRRMPAFGDALTEAEMLGAITHIRSFCRSRSWPRGELNLPRPLVTEKAFPENEAVLTVRYAASDPLSVENEILYEKRIGSRSQVELAVPIALERHEIGWQRGLGDVAVAVKHAFFHSLASGTIVSGAAEVVFPTGKELQGLGGGWTVFEPFAAVGQLLPSDGFVQFQAGMGVPANQAEALNESFWRVAAGKTFIRDRFGRNWTPMVEVLGAMEHGGDEPVLWDVVPQLQVSLSTRQHILLSGGVRIPLTDRARRQTQMLAYILWDWFDGGLLDGW